VNDDDIVRVKILGNFIYRRSLEKGSGHGQTPSQSTLFYIK